MALISSKQIDFSYGISGVTDITGSIDISGSLTLTGAGSASVSYLSASGDIYGNTGVFNYLAVTGNLTVNDLTANTGSFVQLNVSGNSTFSGPISASGDVLIDVESSQSLTIGSAIDALRLGSYTAARNSDISSLIAGSQYGSLIQGENTGHIVIGIRDNHSSDAFAVISGNGTMLSNYKYSKLVFKVDAAGRTNIGGNTAVTGSLNVSQNITAVSGTFDYISGSGDIVIDDITSDTGSFGYIDVSGNIKTNLTASSFVFIDSEQNINEVTPTDGQLFVYTGSQFVATNILDGGEY